MNGAFTQVIPTHVLQHRALMDTEQLQTQTSDHSCYSSLK